MRRLILPILLFLLLLAFQLTVVPMISFDGIAPNLLLVLVVFNGIRYGKIFGSLLGFAFGFLFDLVSGGLLGSAMFAFTLAGFIAGYYCHEDNPSNLYSFNFLFILFYSSTVSLFIYALIVYSNLSTNIITLLFEQGLLPALYTTIFGIPVLFFKPKDAIQ